MSRICTLVARSMCAERVSARIRAPCHHPSTGGEAHERAHHCPVPSHFGPSHFGPSRHIRPSPVRPTRVRAHWHSQHGRHGKRGKRSKRSKHSKHSKHSKCAGRHRPARRGRGRRRDDLRLLRGAGGEEAGQAGRRQGHRQPRHRVRARHRPGLRHRRGHRGRHRPGRLHRYRHQLRTRDGQRCGRRAGLRPAGLRLGHRHRPGRGHRPQRPGRTRLGGRSEPGFGSEA